jgi:uncharacterized membrane protein YqgA involved in biofilm formation
MGIEMGAIVTSVLIFACTSVVGFLVGKISVKSKTEIMIEKLHERMDESEDTMEVVLTCLLPLLIKAKDGKTNGELDTALKKLNEHLIRK